MYRKLIVERLDPAFRKVTRIVDCALPVPKQTEILVRLTYAGVNASDVNFSAGRYLPGASPPLDCGFEGVGIVVAAGSKAAAAGLTRGSAVAISKYGCFAEYILVDMEHKPTWHAPSAAIYPLERAAAEFVTLLSGGLTSSIGLEEAGDMTSGETVLVTGAAGGTGVFAVQLAALAGNRVIGTCGTDDKAEVLRRLGCERAINYKTEDVEAVLKAEYPNGIDLVFEGVGGNMFEICKRCLEPQKGRLVVMGFTSEYTKKDGFTAEGASLVHKKGKEQVRGFLLKDYGHLCPAHMRKMQELIAAGKLDPLVDQTLFKDLEQVADAVEHLHAGKNVGKVVVTLAGTSPVPGIEADLGPLGARIGDCVVVSGLESETGKKLNGQKGVVMTFLQDKGRYGIRFVPENIVNLKPDNLTKLSEEETFTSLQSEILASICGGDLKAQMDALRATSKDRTTFDMKKVDCLAPVIGLACERYGVDWGWFEQMSKTLGEEDEVIAEANTRLEALMSFRPDGSPQPESAPGGAGEGLDDREKLKALLAAILAILGADPAKGILTELRGSCGSKPEFEHAKGAHVFPLLASAYEKYGVSIEWHMSTADALKAEDQEISDLLARMDEALVFSVAGPGGLEKGDCVEVFGLESESGQKMNGEKALVQNYEEEKGRYLVFISPENSVHLKPENLRKLSDKEKITGILMQAITRLTTPMAAGEMDELREKCETRGQFEEARRDVLNRQLERILRRYGVADLGWMFGMAAHFAGEDEQIAAHKKEFDKLVGFGTGPSFLEKGDCVEIVGLDDEFEGSAKRGFVGGFLEKKGCYSVRFPPKNYWMDIKPDNLKKITDEEKVAKIMEQALTRGKSAHYDMKLLRKECTSKAHFEKGRGELLQSLIGGVCTRYNVDLAWFFGTVAHLASADQELAEQKRQLDAMVAFDTGPLGLEKGDFVEVSGLEADQDLNGQAGFVQMYEDDKERYAVAFPPDRVVHVRPDNVRKRSEKDKLSSFLTHSLAALRAPSATAVLEEMRERYESREKFEEARGEKLNDLLSQALKSHGVDLGWLGFMLGQLGPEDLDLEQQKYTFEKLIAYAGLGPLEVEKGTTCVEVFGLESEAGKQMNGQTGVVTKWLKEKERYEVRLGPEKLMSLKPNNLRKLDDRDKLLALQKQLVQAVSAPEAAGPINRIRKESTTVMQFGKAIPKVLVPAFASVYERYGANPGWQGHMLGLYGDDQEIKQVTNKLEELSGFGTVGPDKWEKGCYLEVHGLTSEAGQKMNGMAVFLRGYDDAKGRYDISPADDLQSTKALKGDNLRVIPERPFSGIEEAYAFQEALLESYSSPSGKKMIDQLKDAIPNKQYYIAALRPRLLEFQKPVLERFGFRPDYVGQQYMQRALAPYEADPGFLQKNIDIERMLGLPER